MAYISSVSNSSEQTTKVDVNVLGPVVRSLVNANRWLRGIREF